MKRQALVNSILETMGGRIQSEVSGLLGCQFALSPPVIATLAKEDFFAQSLKKLAMARLSAEGSRNGECFLFAHVKDAVLLGGTLIMLPDAELEQRIAADVFEGEEADAFGEIANIIAGVLTTTFDEYFPEKLRFVKKDLETVIPTKTTAASPLPFPDGSFCQAAYTPNLGGQPLNPIQILFPVELLGLTTEAQPPAAEAEAAPPSGQPRKVAAGANQAAGLAEVFAAAPPSTDTSLPPVEEGGKAPAASESSLRQPPAAPDLQQDSPSGGMISEQSDGVPMVLLLAEDADEGGSFAAVLQEKGYRVQNLAMKDDLRRAMTAREVKAIFLVMREVSEQGFAAVIRAKSAGGPSVPLIAAGPQWTRKTVLQAVKYGICDIVMTPATPQEIGEKIDRNLMPVER